MLATGIVLGISRAFVAEPTQWNTKAAMEVLWLALASNLAYLFWDRAMRNGDIVLVAACSYFTPLLSTTVSSLYLGVTPGARLWIGCALVIAGAIICKLALKAPPEP
jgi:drug/metabolite transporter (DMT)-like permease